MPKMGLHISCPKLFIHGYPRHLGGGNYDVVLSSLRVLKEVAPLSMLKEHIISLTFT